MEILLQQWRGIDGDESTLKTSLKVSLKHMFSVFRSDAIKYALILIQKNTNIIIIIILEWASLLVQKNKVKKHGICHTPTHSKKISVTS